MAVSRVDQGGVLRSTSELVVKAGSEDFEFEFRGADKAQKAYALIMTELLQNEALSPEQKEVTCQFGPMLAWAAT